MSNRFARFLLLFTALWLPVQTMAARSMPMCRHAQARAMAAVAAEHSAVATHCHEAPAADQAANDKACDHCEMCQLAGASFMLSAPLVAGMISTGHRYALPAVTAPPSHITEPPQHPPRRSA
jgi:ABC-type nickel/cobalt efflux system permease component RcnA